MPVIYPKKIRNKFKSLELDKLKNRLIELGYSFIRDGGFKPEDEPFKFSNYLFYKHPETGMNIRIGYDYPILIMNKNPRNIIFEICYCKRGDNWWTDITPDFRQHQWKIISNLYNIDF